MIQNPTMFKMELSNLFCDFTNHLINLITMTNNAGYDIKKYHLSLCWMKKEMIAEIAKLKIKLLSFISESLSKDYLNGSEYFTEVSCRSGYNTSFSDMDVNITQESYSDVPETDLGSNEELNIMPSTPQSSITDSFDESSNFSSDDQYANDADIEMDSIDDDRLIAGMIDFELRNIREMESIAAPLLPRLDVISNALDGIEIPERVIEVEVETSLSDGPPKKSDSISGGLEGGCCMHEDYRSNRMIHISHSNSESEYDNDDMPIRGQRCNANGSFRIVRMIKGNDITHNFSSKNISSQLYGVNSDIMSSSSSDEIKVEDKIRRRKRRKIKY